MPYTIYTIPQVSPATITVPGPRDTRVVRPNPGPVVQNVVYSPPDLDIYSADAAVRRVLMRDGNGQATGQEIFAAFPKIRDPKASEIRAEGSRRLLALTTPYAAEERESWPTQQAEADKWLLNNSADVPMITAMAQTRGITIADLVSRIMENVNLFRTYAGAILGEQQRLLDLVYAAIDYDSMQGVTW